MTINQFVGEILVNPCPLETSERKCSHGCIYCYACNRGYDGNNSVSTLRQLDRLPKSNTDVSRLLKAGYPVVVSNRSDPFSASNRADAVPLFKALTEKGVPAFIQTKGGVGLEPVADRLPRSLWYFTITTMDETIREIIEPGAPSSEERIRQIEYVRKAGHEVIVGVNPLVPDWMPLDTWSELCSRLKAVGVRGAVFQKLNLNARHLPTGRAMEFLSKYLDNAKKRVAAQSDFEHYCRIREVCDSERFAYYGAGQWARTSFFDAFRDVYPKTYSVTQDFVNWVWDNKETGDRVTFKEYLDVMLPKFPSGDFELSKCLYATVRNVGREGGIPYRMTFEKFLEFVWSDRRVTQCPARLRLLAFAGVDNEAVERDNEYGLPVMVINKAGFKTGQHFAERTEK